MRNELHMTDESDGWHKSFDFFFYSLGDAEKFQSIRIFASIEGCRQHMKAAPARDNSSIPPLDSTGNFLRLDACSNK